MSIVKRRVFANHPEVIQAGADSWAASKATWADPDAPTPVEEVAAKDARLAAYIARADELISEG